MAAPKNPLYKYKAISKNGSISMGYMTAKNEVDLFQKLDEYGLELIRSSEKKPTIFDKYFSPKIELREKLQFYVQLQQMMRAGVTVLNALDNLVVNTRNVTLRDKIVEIRAFLSDGMKFSEALAQFPNVFNKIEVAIVKAGEETGQLAQSFEFITEYLKNEDAIRRKIKKATRYPMMVAGVVVVAVIVLLGVVVPDIVSFLKVIDGGELPFVTVSLIATSEFVQAYGLYMLFIGAGLILGFNLYRRYSADFNHKSDGWFLLMPVVGELLRKIEVSRFCYVFRVLYTAGMPVVSIINQAKDVCSNKVISYALADASTNIKNGSTISSGLNDTGQFPSVVVQMFMAGEESGDVSEVLQYISEYFDTEVDQAIDNFISMIEPGLTVVFGLIIIWIAAAVFGPIYGMLGSLGI